MSSTLAQIHHIRGLLRRWITPRGGGRQSVADEDELDNEANLPEDGADRT
jgi:hypothetical protein